MTEVKSSAISHVGYDEGTKELRIRFTSGAEYTYPDVSAEEHQALMGSDSIGKHFASKFRGRECCRQ